MKKIISINSLTKKYGDLTAVDNISFDVSNGSFFAFLGPNGAGKSTTINILCSLLTLNSGTVEIDGFNVVENPKAVRDRIGVVFQDSFLDKLLTVRENLESRAAFYGLRGKDFKTKLKSISVDTGIEDFLDRKYGTLSGGQRRRADIARALVNTPKLLFLDEPTTGLDPQTRKSVWKTIKRLQEDNGVTVFLTTHYMEEAAKADQVAIIDNGQIVAEGTPTELKVKYSSDLLKIVPKNSNDFKNYLESKNIEYIVDGTLFTIDVTDSKHALLLLKECEELIDNFEVVRGNMDDVFLRITGHKIRDEE